MDRENIIKGIQECDLNGGLIGNCPYKGILALLKEQEPIKPTINEYGEAYCICGENVGIIPHSKNLPKILSKYCSECGRKMNWNDLLFG